MGLHVALFLFSGFVIVTIQTLFSEPDDTEARKALPRRLLHFFGGCVLVAVVMLVFEHTFAAIR